MNQNKIFSIIKRPIVRSLSLIFFKPNVLFKKKIVPRIILVLHSTLNFIYFLKMSRVLASYNFRLSLNIYDPLSILSFVLFYPHKS